MHPRLLLNLATILTLMLDCSYILTLQCKYGTGVLLLSETLVFYKGNKGTQSFAKVCVHMKIIHKCTEDCA